ncbi:flavin reductase family protein [uncultured Thiohalocapsa sp.]|uniref:flavin reductase family protein n=1 Tax=uncultured Thiohalocapsa sp. TaxID=768990 RepID=UPI0025E05E2F|nr:flavin reductase family protein [uncultured Thiohalocapsa sp.]
MPANAPGPSHPQPLDKTAAAAVNAVYHLYDPPLWLVTAAESPEPGSTRGGCIATFVARASIVRDRPRMVAGIARQHHTWRMIEASRCFAVYLLPETALELVWRFGLATGKDADKYADLPDTRTPLGNPRVRGPMAWLDCRVENAMSSGDRSIYLAEVTGGGVLDDSMQPLSAGRLMDLAPADKRAELDRLYARDGGIDAAAIDAWRMDGKER